MNLKFAKYFYKEFLEVKLKVKTHMLLVLK